MKFRSELTALLAGTLIATCALRAGAEPTPPASATPATRSVPLKPYKARYQVGYMALSGGQIEAQLRRGDRPGLWVYETQAFPNMIGRLAVSPEAREHSTMEITPAGVRPLAYEFYDGSQDVAQDVRLRFDWSRLSVTGNANGKDFELDVPAGTQDTASVQAAMIVALAAGRQPSAFAILTGSKLRDYRYWSEGKATLNTALGKLDTVVWASQRDGSTRVGKVWYAPSLGYVPVQAIQYRKGKQLVQMRIVSLER
jgi:hypothetical protein